MLHTTNYYIVLHELYTFNAYYVKKYMIHDSWLPWEVHRAKVVDGNKRLQSPQPPSANMVWCKSVDKSAVLPTAYTYLYRFLFCRLSCRRRKFRVITCWRVIGCFRYSIFSQFASRWTYQMTLHKSSADWIFKNKCKNTDLKHMEVY